MEKQRLPRKEREKLMHRKMILTAALSLFSEKGYHNISMHQIAEKAEFGIGTLYKFFQNKEELYKALIMEKVEEYHRVLMGVLDREDDVLAVVDNYIATKTKLFSSDLEIMRLYFAETRGASFNIKAGLDQDIRRLYDEFLTRLASVLETGIHKKIFRKADPYQMTLALEGLIHAFVFHWLENSEQDSYKTDVPVIRELFLRGVLAE
ncbi:MAG: TetR/AcrR family transcriptional regulator [bacterium]